MLLESVESPVMLIGYARVSTEDQDLTLQLDALNAAGCERIYEDRKSGKTLKNRPGWKTCMADLHPGDTLIVWKMDRLGRNTVEVLNLLEKLRAEEVKVRSLTEGFDADTPIGRMVITIMASVSQYEREVLGERTRAGMAVSKARGRRHGGIPTFAEPRMWDAAMAALKAYRDDPETGDDPIPNRTWARAINELTGADVVTSTVRNNRDILLSEQVPDDWVSRWEQREKLRRDRAKKQK